MIKNTFFLLYLELPYLAIVIRVGAGNVFKKHSINFMRWSISS